MNRSEWGEFVLDFILKLVLAYAAKHSADAAQEVLSKASFAVAQHDTQLMNTRAQKLLPLGEASILRDERLLAQHFPLLSQAVRTQAISSLREAGVRHLENHRSEDTSYDPSRVHTDWRSDIHPVRG